MCAQPTTPAVSKQVPTGSVTLHVTEYGDRPDPVILLHGIGSDASTWWPVVDELAAHFRLIVPEQRGHGKSDKPESGYQIPLFADDLEGLLAAYEIDRPLVFGHSMGGMVTLEWAARNPDRGRGFVIEDTPFRPAPNSDDLFANWIAMATSTPTEVEKVYRRDNPHWPDEDVARRAVMITSTAPAVFHEMRGRRWLPPAERFAKLTAVTTPALLLYGDTEAGSMIPQEDADQFAATLKAGKTYYIPGGSHSLHRDFTRPLLDATIPFLLAL